MARKNTRTAKKPVIEESSTVKTAAEEASTQEAGSLDDAGTQSSGSLDDAGTQGPGSLDDAGKTEDADAEEISERSHAYDEIRAEILEYFRSFSPAEQMMSQITEEHITEYIEGLNEERIQKYRERREKRLLLFLEIIAVLTAIVLVVKFLGNNPALLTTVIYTIGGLLALYIWKRPRRNDDDPDKQSGR